MDLLSVVTDNTAFSLIIIAVMSLYLSNLMVSRQRRGTTTQIMLAVILAAAGSLGFLHWKRIQPEDEPYQNQRLCTNERGHTVPCETQRTHGGRR